MMVGEKPLDLCCRLIQELISTWTSGNGSSGFRYIYYPSNRSTHPLYVISVGFNYDNLGILARYSLLIISRICNEPSSENIISQTISY